MTAKKDDGVQIRIEPDGRFTAPIRLFRHGRYTVQRKRNGELVFLPVEGSALPPKKNIADG